ncbi:hypothetical protein [Mycobacterium sp. 1245805.9]|uniref:hypothetical protein n=1 Tax=Mycobacterium sp. 1245805.9 TaxID=1856862 RepID=UPI000A895445|nr:hypothetical protein [Mycobacterium sp. 1245805.9]
MRKDVSPRSRVPRAQRLAMRRGYRCTAAVMIAATALAASAVGVPSAAADFTGSLRDAVMQARQGSSCGALRPEALADQTAAIAARSTDTYLDHNARVIPVSDPLPILKDLGLNAGKAKLLQGAGQTEADAIKAILVTGYKELPDCSYTAYGTSTLPNTNLGSWFLSAVVLVGP